MMTNNNYKQIPLTNQRNLTSCIFIQIKETITSSTNVRTQSINNFAFSNVYTNYQVKYAVTDNELRDDIKFFNIIQYSMIILKLTEIDQKSSIALTLIRR